MGASTEGDILTAAPRPGKGPGSGDRRFRSVPGNVSEPPGGEGPFLGGAGHGAPGSSNILWTRRARGLPGLSHRSPGWIIRPGD